MSGKLLPIFLLTVCPLIVTMKRMRWIPDTNLDNWDNYDPKGPPCRNDHLTFPARGPSVYLQRNQTLMEIVLPNDGEIVLAEGSVLTFPETNDNSCSGKNRRFIGTVAKPWLDPRNWCVTEDSSDNCETDQPYLLDTERIPCDSDEVIFPSGSGFYVDIARDVALRMGSLKVAGQPMTTDSFRSYLNSNEGRLRFTSVNGSLGDVSVTITNPRACSDSTGCLCRAVTGPFQDRVCDLETPRCDHVTCATPFQPQGRCCHVCGALLVIPFRVGFRLQDLKNLISDTFQNQNVDQQSVKTDIAKIEEKVIQVTLESSNNDATAANIGRALKEELDRDPKYKAFDVKLISSELRQPDAHTGEGPSSRSGLIAGIIIGLIVVVLLILGACYWYRNRDRVFTRPRLPSISFPDLPDFRSIFSREGSHDKDNFEMRHQVAVFDNRRVFDVNLGFENPTYGDLYADMRFRDPDETGIPQKDGFNNPLYDSPRTVEKKEPIPDEYLSYFPPPQPEDQRSNVKATEAKVDKVKDDESRTDSLGKRLQTPFRLAASRLRGPKLEEDEPDEEGREVTLKVRDLEKKGQRSMFGKANDHERLEEGDEENEQKSRGAVERKWKRGPEGRKEGFGNPLYAEAEEGRTRDADLGEPGSFAPGYETGVKGQLPLGTGRGDKTGFENPLFDDSKRPERETCSKLQRSHVQQPEDVSGTLSSQKIFGATGDESTA